RQSARSLVSENTPVPFVLPSTVGHGTMHQITSFSEEAQVLTSLEKAKQFLAQKASRLALTAVPLAALALTPPAKANVIFDSGGGSGGGCFVSTPVGGSGGCGTFEQNPTGGNSQANWIALAGFGIAPSGGVIRIGVSGGSTNSGSISGSIPVS